MTIIHWFRRDLRLHDNTALAHAIGDSGGLVLPVFILDDRLLKGQMIGPAKVSFLLESLADLAQTLKQSGSRLVLRRGDPRYELLRLAHVCRVQAVYWNRDYSPYALSRDASVESTLQSAGFRTQHWKDAVIYEANELKTTTDRPYTVYTPYARRWRQQLQQQPVAVESATSNPLKLQQGDWSAVESVPLPDSTEFGFTAPDPLFSGGANAAQQLFDRFTDCSQHHSIATYHQQRDQPALPATSKLSPHLHLGTISPRACVRAARSFIQRADTLAVDGASTWLNELIWRDFYNQILAQFPSVVHRAFKSQFADIAWDNNPDLFAAWCAGQTGYPIVDAAMRQLNTEAWMHNRTRMIVASFLTKDCSSTGSGANATLCST